MLFYRITLQKELYGVNLKRKPYIIDGVVGNSKMLATLGSDGELYRLWWPQIGYPQHIDEFVFGIYAEELVEEIQWLNGGEWSHQQRYIEDTNVLLTESVHTELPIQVTITDFCLPESDTFIRNVQLNTTSQNKIEIELYVSASFAIAENTRYNSVAFDKEQDALVYFRHEYAFAVGSPLPCHSFEAGKRRSVLTVLSEDKNEREMTGHETVQSGNDRMLNGNEIAMSINGMMKWKIELTAHAQVNVPVFISAGDSFENALIEMSHVKKLETSQHLKETVSYWHEFINRGRKLNTTNEDVQNLFKRSILAFKLMSDKTYGSLIAAPEFDEDFTRCGGYAYCWGRDAAYITTAIDQAGYHDLVDHFYDWTLKAQSDNGSWQQRHFMDGKLAPHWGLQIDETGSILWGMWQHFLEVNDRSFAEKVWSSVQKGADFLSSFIDPVTKLPLPSRDLWEERDGEHIYSAAAVYGGLISAYKFAILLGTEQSGLAWKKTAEEIKESIISIGWSETKGHFLRGIKLQVSKERYLELNESGSHVLTEKNDKGYTSYLAWEDDIVDVSLLGISVPFDLINITDEKMDRMASKIEERLTSPIVGGIKRYEDDHYIGGNPWVLTTLWLSLYHTKRGNEDKGKNYLQWAIDHQTELGLLPEQIDKETGETAWVVPLTWSHAMFVLAALALDDLK